MDLKLRSHIRNTYPGACAIEFLSQLEILTINMIGWDDKKGVGSPGIFGEPEAYGTAIEEQGRKTLHGHILVWIKDFNILRNLLFHEDQGIRKEAKNEMLKYVENVMNSSYGGLHISVEESHDESKEEDETKIQDESNQGDIKLADTFLVGVSKQKLRNIRHKDLCIIKNGVVATDAINKNGYSTVDIVNNA